jgi:hypothetical protein
VYILNLYDGLDLNHTLRGRLIPARITWGQVAQPLFSLWASEFGDPKKILLASKSKFPWPRWEALDTRCPCHRESDHGLLVTTVTPEGNCTSSESSPLTYSLARRSCRVISGSEGSAWNRGFRAISCATADTIRKWPGHAAGVPICRNQRWRSKTCHRDTRTWVDVGVARTDTGTALGHHTGTHILLSKSDTDFSH